MLTKDTFFIKEQVASGKLTEVYEIYDPHTGHQIGVAREDISTLLKWVRFFVGKKSFPTTINVMETGKDKPLFSIKKSFSLITSKFTIFDKNNNSIGYFKTKLIEINRGFLVYDDKAQLVAQVKGDLLSGTNFKFNDSNKKEIGIVTKKWSGLGKELFTTADNYVVNITNPGKNKEKNTALLLSAGLVIDTLYFEK